ncbi:sulfite exporter TauE/SafE family protein [Pseudochelatococcus sp. B33]
MTGDIEVMALAMLAAFIVGLSKGGLANVGSAAVPIMALVMPPLAAAAMLLPIYILSDVVGVWLYRRSYSRRNLAILIPAGLAGVIVGWAVASRMSDAVAGLLVGVIGIAFCLHFWLRRSSAQASRADVPRGLFWGTLTGFTSFITHSGGATFQIYTMPQRMEKLVFAGTSTILFATINAAKLIPYWQLQQMDLRPSTLALLVPTAIAGTFSGAWITKTMPTEAFFRFIQAALFLISVKLVFDAVRTLA